jgi:hypothetical protein
MIETTKSINRRFWAAATAVSLILLAACVWPASNKQVPKELIGEWHTTAPNYADRSFEINSVCINFTTGGGTVSTGFIKEVKVVSEGNRELYTISYTVDDAPNEVSFYYDQSKDKVIRFKNQEKIDWKRDPES